MTRLLVVDDHEIVRAGVKRLLAEVSELTVAGEAGSGADAVSMVRESDWDVVLLDISMPDMSGIDALQQIKQWKPELPVLILSSHPEEIYAINLLRAGAGGYLNKVCAPAELAGAIRSVASGGKYVSSSLRQKLASESRGDGRNMPHSDLSQREFQVFCRLADGQALTEKCGRSRAKRKNNCQLPCPPPRKDGYENGRRHHCLRDQTRFNTVA